MKTTIYDTRIDTEHTPGPWKWREANHTGVYETSESRTLVSCSMDVVRESDGKNLGPIPVLVPGARSTARVAGLMDAISLEIHGRKPDESLIAAAPDLLEALKAVVDELDLHSYSECLDTGPSATVCPGCVALGKARAAIAKAVDSE